MIDLHAHTTCSDGTDTPAELIHKAAEIGIDTLAIADHDTVEAYETAPAAAAEVGIELIPAVEISCSAGGASMHLLGYHIDPHHPALLETLGTMQAWRASRNVRIIERLQHLGMDVTVEEVEAVSRGGQMGRPHMAQVLLSKGYVQTIGEAFDEYLGTGRPAYVARSHVSPEEGFALVHAAGGAAVAAHPMFLKQGDDQLTETLRAWREAGLDGIEVYYSAHPNDRIEFYRSLARRLGLVFTAGSDYHGTVKPDVHLGRIADRLPSDAEILEPLAEAAGKWR